MISISYPRIPFSPPMIAKGTNPAQLTAIGTVPVPNPAMWRRPARIASICAALFCAANNRMRFPVVFSRCCRKVVPHPLVRCRILARRVRKYERRRIDGLGGRVGHEIAVRIDVADIERGGGWHGEHGGAYEPRDGSHPRTTPLLRIQHSPCAPVRRPLVR